MNLIKRFLNWLLYLIGNEGEGAPEDLPLEGIVNKALIEIASFEDGVGDEDVEAIIRKAVTTYSDKVYENSRRKYREKIAELEAKLKEFRERVRS